MTEILMTAAALDILGLTCGGIAVWRAARRGPPRRAVWAVVLGGACVCLVAVVIGLLGFHNSFAAMRLLAHALFCVWAPLLVCAGVLLWRQCRWLAMALPSCGVAMDLAYSYARRIEPYRLEVTHYEVVSPKLRGVRQPITVVVLADLQTDRIGAYERGVFATMDRLRADLILLPGDYIQIYGDPVALERERRALVELFNGLRHRPRYGIWGVDGDVDFAAEVFRGSVAKPIQDAFEVLPGDPPLQLLGLSRPASRRPLTPEQERRIAAFPGLTLVMGHAPDFVCDDIAAFARGETRPGTTTERLCIAGHIHGGQVVVPGFGPPITLSQLPRRYSTGLHRFGAMHLLVSRGVGLERGYAPRIRFLCRPELAVIRLRG
ncbi:MAG: metallophosphoesterase [Planctomycetes bacterium]|nr:metallophosphoesterase [Planctomycetota bacterium]